MAGWGRNVAELKKFDPKEIVLVDFNKLSIDEAKKKFSNDPKVKPYCADLNKWIKTDNSFYRLTVCIWTLSYMEEA